MPLLPVPVASETQGKNSFLLPAATRLDKQYAEDAVQEAFLKLLEQ